MWTPVQAVAEVNKKERGLEPTGSRVRTAIFSCTKHSQLTAPARCSMCMNDFFRPGPLQLTLLIRDSSFVSAWKANWYICKLSLKHPKVYLTVNAWGAKNGREIATQGSKAVKQLHKLVDWVNFNDHLQVRRQTDSLTPRDFNSRSRPRAF